MGQVTRRQVQNGYCGIHNMTFGVRLFTVGQTKPGSGCFLLVTHVVKVRLLIAGHSTCVRVRVFIVGHKMTSGS